MGNSGLEKHAGSSMKAESPKVQLDGFLAKFTPEVRAIAKAALAKMRRRLPGALELVYDNYNALAIGFGPSERASEAIFSIALFPRWVSLFFLQSGAKLPDPQKLLKAAARGSGISCSKARRRWTDRRSRN